MASSLKSSPKTYLKVVKDSLRNEAEIKQGNDVEFVKQMKERGFDSDIFVFDGYEDVVQPNTDPHHLNGNSEENVNTNPMSEMPTNSKNEDRKKRKSERNWLNKAKKREAAKALAEVEAKKIVDESAESLEKAATKALTEAIKALVKSEESLINDNWEPTSRVQAKTLTCPLGSEATHITDWSSVSSSIWTCKHSDALMWKSLYLLDLNGDLFVFGSVEVPKISTEDTPQSYFPIVCGDWDVRDMRKMVADLVQDDDKEINDNLEDQFKKMLEVDVFNQEDDEFYENYEFYEEVSDDTGIGESSKDNSVHSQGSSDGSFCIVKRLLRRNGYKA